MIKDAQKEDRQEIYEIWRMLYPEQKRAYLNFYFKKYYDQGQCLITTQDNRIIATLQMNEHIMMFLNRRILVSYFLGIATIPDYRRRGHMGELMNSALDEAQHNYLITFIQAENYKVYERFGFEIVCERKQYVIPAHSLSSVNMQGVSYNFNAKNLMNLYEEYTRHFDGWFLRNEEYYEAFIEQSRLNRGNICVYRNSSGKISGYAAYIRDGKEAHISEIIYLESIALVKMLRFICGNYPEVNVEVSQSESLEMLFPMLIPRKRAFLMAKINQMDLFNKLFGFQAHTTKEAFSMMRKPFWNHEYY